MSDLVVGSASPRPAAPRSAGPVGATARPCLHCGATFLPETDDGRFCCTGCESVYALVQGGGLGRYYDLRGDAQCPVPDAPGTTHDHAWLEPIEAELARGAGRVRVELDLQGLHCTACVWLLESLFRRQPEGLRLTINPALGRADLLVLPGFSLRAFVTEVERFGYRFGPPRRGDAAEARGLLTRLGVSAALAMNAMIFALPLYLGLASGPLYRVFGWVAFALTGVTVLVGGAVFIRSAIEAARRRVLHLDQPIALGIVLAFGGSAWSFFHGREGQGAYFDTVAVFITLMLTGRWLQERVLAHNRRFILQSDGVDGLYTRRIEGAEVRLLKAREVLTGDRLLITSGDLIPVDAELVSAQAQCSLEWISGESAPRRYTRGERILAGSFNVGAGALHVLAAQDFERSSVASLLRSPTPREGDAARATAWWQRLSGVYVVTVLLVATLGWLGWFLATRDAARATEIATAVLVVTCPCAFGIATPLAYELVQAGLRRHGLFVRTPGFLDRAARVKKVVFDKTGTLTTGALTLQNPEQLDALSGDDRAALHNLVVRSNHPRSVAIRRALDSRGAHFDPDAEVIEEAGHGVTLTRGDTVWRLGAAAWAAPGRMAPDGAVAFARDGLVIAAFRTEEHLRKDARAEVTALRADGYDVYILSGDTQARAHALAATVGIADDHAIGGATPSAKAAWLAAHDRDDTLMVGDGINDTLAVGRAFCAGTPSIERPFLAARTDFFVVTAGLGPIARALGAAHALERVHRRNLGMAIAYNVVSVTLSLSGHMSPLLCAVFMPLSSLTVLAATTASLSGRSALWKSSFSRSL